MDMITPRLHVDVRPVAESDIVRLSEQFPMRSTLRHTERLRRQQAGSAVYLIAWHDELPVGHALLKWNGAENAHAVGHRPGDCPEIEDLFVREEMRSQGIGTQLLQAAEKLARERGRKMIGLSVSATGNDRARRLYDHLGYRDAGFGAYLECGETVDRQGQKHSWEEVCIYLVKRLD
jgi:GNAT superfamily N-acetyltransferase